MKSKITSSYEPPVSRQNEPGVDLIASWCVSHSHFREEKEQAIGSLKDAVATGLKKSKKEKKESQNEVPLDEEEEDVDIEEMDLLGNDDF